MKDADRTIERLLAALRDAEPSAAMERRILEALEAREAAAAPPFWSGMRPIATSLAAALAIAGMLIVAVAVRQHRSAPADTRSHATAPPVRGTTQPEVVSAASAHCTSTAGSTGLAATCRQGFCSAGNPGGQLPCTAFAVNRAGEVAVAPGPSARSARHSHAQPR